MELWATTSSTKLHKAKHQVPHLGQGSGISLPRGQPNAGAGFLERWLVPRASGIWTEPSSALALVSPEAVRQLGQMVSVGPFQQNWSI